tara:strand:+ start:56 stop:946 length:891 start_codon:yes stop_codon:yes gene_type:complete
MKPYLSSYISSEFGLNHYGNDTKIKNASSIYNPKSYSITWSKSILSANDLNNLESIGNIYIILPDGSNNEYKLKNISYSIVNSPRNTFSNILRKLFQPPKKIGISTNSYISKNTIFGENTYVGDFTKISNEVIIGNNCQIGDNCVINGPAEIGNNTEILPGAVIGHDSLGVTIENEVPKIFPQIGGVKIGKNCRIGVNASISKATLDLTEVGDNVMIGDYAHIGHNSKINENSIITAGSIICGKVIIGKNVWVGAGSKILENVKISSNIKVGIGAVVLTDLKKVGTYIGNPAKKIK